MEMVGCVIADSTEGRVVHDVLSVSFWVGKKVVKVGLVFEFENLNVNPVVIVESKVQ